MQTYLYKNDYIDLIKRIFRCKIVLYLCSQPKVEDDTNHYMNAYAFFQ